MLDMHHRQMANCLCLASPNIVKEINISFIPQTPPVKGENQRGGIFQSSLLFASKLAPDLTISLTLLDSSTFVARFLSFYQSYLHFDLPIFIIH